MAFTARCCCVLLILVAFATVAENRSKKKLYYYTNKNGIDAISSSGYLKKSTGKNAKFGEGVYLTSLDPWKNTRVDIAKNNWRTETVIKEGKTDYLIQLTIEMSAVKKAKDTKRNIYIYKGNLYLKYRKWSIFQWSIKTGKIRRLHSCASGGVNASVRVKAEVSPLLIIMSMISISTWFTLN